MTTWNAALYDQKHAFVYQFGQELVALLDPQAGERILDLGCGTGHLTHKLAATGAQVTGLDKAPTMLEQARLTYPDLTWVVGDASQFSFAQAFDGIFSNAALHWVTHAEQAVICIAQALKPGGRFVAEFGGKKNIAHIKQALIAARLSLGYAPIPDDPWYFPSIGEYALLLEKHGLGVVQAWHFARPTALEDGELGLRNWLTMFASALLADLLPQHQAAVLTQIETNLRPQLYREGCWYADYYRLRLIAIKEAL